MIHNALWFVAGAIAGIVWSIGLIHLASIEAARAARVRRPVFRDGVGWREE